MRISTSGTLSPALRGEAETRDATAEWAVEAAAEIMEAIMVSYRCRSHMKHAKRST
jgi:hypothetical protein